MALGNDVAKSAFLQAFRRADFSLFLNPESRFQRETLNRERLLYKFHKKLQPNRAGKSLFSAANIMPHFMGCR